MSGLRSANRWLALVLVAAPCWADCCKSSVAVIASLSGRATVRSPGSRDRIAAASLDWLLDGQTLEVAPKSQAVVILVNGHRYELSGGAKVTVVSDAAPKITGAARELPALPPIPRLAPVTAESATTSASVRIRGSAEMNGLYPRAGTVALPEKVTLRYNAVPEATSYQVALEDDGGASLLKVTTEATEVAVANGTIQAGQHYSWHVRAMRSGFEIATGINEFTTLSAEDTLRRAQFASAVSAGTNDPAMLALLADVDLRLGLIAEACEEFSAALTQKPDDAILRQALDSARRKLVGKIK